MLANPHFRKLEKKIAEQTAKRTEFIMAGGASDYTQYREEVAYIRGLHDVLRLCEEIEQENQ